MIKKHILPPGKSLVLIANNWSLKTDYSHTIDQVDTVVRMNRCVGCGPGKHMGSKTDILSIVSAETRTHGFGVPITWMRPGGPVRETLSEVWYTRPKGWSFRHEKDESEWITKAQAFPESMITYPTKAFWKKMEDMLRKEDNKYTSPSTGFVTLMMILNDPRFKKHTKLVVGFSHDGWKGHPLAAEKKLMAKFIEQGILQRMRDLPEETP